MGGAETEGKQVGSYLTDAHQGYRVVNMGALSRGSGGGSRVRSDRGDDGEKKVVGQVERVMRPQSGTKRN